MEVSKVCYFEEDRETNIAFSVILAYTFPVSINITIYNI